MSPQRWGRMMLSKHHYALELARRGNTVYFLNPPDNDKWSLAPARKRIRISANPKEPGLKYIDQQLFFPYWFKFHARTLFDRLMKGQFKDILDVVPEPVDIVWSFDLGNLIPLSLFHPEIFRVFHPVDEPANAMAIRAADGADVLISVTEEILQKYSATGIPSFFVNHGLSAEFLRPLPEDDAGHETIRIGMSGNLLRPDLDRPVLLQMLEQNPGNEFHFYGSYLPRDSNIGASEDAPATAFVNRLAQVPNVRLHGVLQTAELAPALNQMDVLLICYDLHLDQSKGTNYHKVMEYLSTGKVIVANNITTYRDQPDLVRMISDRETNSGLPELLADTLQNLATWNSDTLQQKRKEFARANSYTRQLDRIDSLLKAVSDAGPLSVAAKKKSSERN